MSGFRKTLAGTVLAASLFVTAAAVPAQAAVPAVSQSVSSSVQTVAPAVTKQATTKSITSWTCYPTEWKIVVTIAGGFYKACQNIVTRKVRILGVYGA